MRSLPLFAALAALSACSVPGTQAPAAGELAIFSARPHPALHVAAANSERQQVLNGASAAAPKPPGANAQDNNVAVRVSGKDGADDALTLQWSNAWYASMRFEGAPQDLRPYIPSGVLAFDLNVKDLSKGGLAIKVGCGKDCERQVPYMLPARAMEGQGWRRVVLSMSCFVHEGDDFSAVTQPFALQAGGAGEVSVANVGFQASGTPNASCPDYKTVSVTPDMLNESWSLDWWRPRHEKKLEEARALKAAGKNSEVVFIGDSITQGWEKEGAPVWSRHYQKYNALNLGFGGDRTENVLWRLLHGEVDGLDPKVAVLMFGTNNTGHRYEDPALIAAGIKRNIDELQRRLPNTKILLLAIFPRDATADGPARRNNERVNAILPSFADQRKVHFVNLNAAFVGADGVLSKDIMPDLLHPNEKGYELWAKAMEPELQKLLKP
ncbi:GDSL-type esterase/lipase family protein [Pseudoduganella namucuonensis]|uniref:Beta-glucosidase n=1 Tax=Pseudoduganella namucuonensis TaxID=1035707 RepID=A0A1I7GY20_9BURK|nr:GDSL-type esterase/lipase family protein [Pseudoduganella namucuonensis]SFU53354.1 beta-glucosidase [Pseudoduganella namucuonensis]